VARRILRTRISHPPNRTTYGASMWSHILRDQLDVDEATFWAAVHDGVQAARSAPVIPAETLPVEVAFLLINRVGLTREQVAAMTRSEAIGRLNRYWTEQS
jgi:hypothetical protein